MSKKHSKLWQKTKRERQKRTVEKKKLSMQKILLRQFDFLQTAETKEKPDFGEDNFEYLLAQDRFEQQEQKKKYKEILFRNFDIRKKQFVLYELTSEDYMQTSFKYMTRERRICA